MTEDVARTLAPGMHGCTFGGGPLVTHGGPRGARRVQPPARPRARALARPRAAAGLAALASVTPRSPSARARPAARDRARRRRAVRPPALVRAAREQGCCWCAAASARVRLLPPLIVTSQEISRGARAPRSRDRESRDSTFHRRRKSDDEDSEAFGRAVLAYSGGLDTSIIVHWLKQRYGCEVVCYCSNVGQGGDELDGLAERARRLAPISRRRGLAHDVSCATTASPRCARAPCPRAATCSAPRSRGR
jgi:hypothetical protein